MKAYIPALDHLPFFTRTIARLFSVLTENSAYALYHATESYSFFSFGEYREILERAGFRIIRKRF